MSVTTLIKEFFTPFDEDECIQRLKESENHPLKDFSEDQIKEIWNEYGKYCRRLGSCFHKIIERRLKNSLRESSGEKIDLKIKNIPGLENYISKEILQKNEVDSLSFFKQEIKQLKRYLKKLKEEGYFIKGVEERVEKDGISGVIDAVFERENKEILIVDWKWTKDDLIECEKKLPPPLNDISDNKFGMYCLQLIIYEKLLGKKCEKRIVQFYSSLENYREIKVCL